MQHTCLVVFVTVYNNYTKYAILKLCSPDQSWAAVLIGYVRHAKSMDDEGMEADADS